MTSRRQFICAATLTGLYAGLPQAVRASAASRLWLSARVDDQGKPHATVFDDRGRASLDLPLPTRGHGAAYCRRTQTLVMASRRPGDFLAVMDARVGTLLHRVAAAEGRCFNGHVAFRADRLYASETRIDTRPEQPNGVIGIYDAASGYRRVGEYLTHGNDAHELLLLGEHTLVVANGGLVTHPDAPGVKLNVDHMDSSLAYIDARDGRLLDLQQLPSELQQLSLRHLAIGHDGTVAVAMQYEGASTALVPLIAVHRPGAAALDLLRLPASALSGLRNYCGSVAFDRSGRVLGVTSPRGGVSVFWSLDERRLLGRARVADGCGIAPGPQAGEFLVSSGLGGVRRCDVASSQLLVGDGLLDASRWDNHLLAVNGA